MPLETAFTGITSVANFEMILGAPIARASRG